MRALNYYSEMYAEVQFSIYQRAISYRKGDKFAWEKIKPLQLKLTWESFMRTGVVLHEKLVDKLVTIIAENTIMLEIMSSCMGHTEYCGVKEMISIYEPSSYYRRKLFRVFHDEDWAEFSNRQPLLSDFALKPLNDLLFKLLSEKDYGQKIVLMDRMLNVIHMRSDLAELYVEGGSRTLSQLSGTPEKQTS